MTCKASKADMAIFVKIGVEGSYDKAVLDAFLPSILGRENIASGRVRLEVNDLKGVNNVIKKARKSAEAHEAYVRGKSTTACALYIALTDDDDEKRRKKLDALYSELPPGNEKFRAIHLRANQVLEAWLLGDLVALGRKCSELPTKVAEKYCSQDEGELGTKEELAKALKKCGITYTLRVAEEIAEGMEIANNTSPSFRAFVCAITTALDAFTA